VAFNLPEGAVGFNPRTKQPTRYRLYVRRETPTPLASFPKTASETRRQQRLKNRAPFHLPNSESAEAWTPNSQIETGFPRMGVCEDEYNQRQKRLPFLTGSVCVVGSVLAAA
jgi:hypothetical protein